MKHILVVDDDDTFRNRLLQAFKKRGLIAHAALDLASSLEIAGSHRLDFAVVDLRLAQDVGLDVIRELKILQPHLSIVMLTGFGSIATTVEAMRLGATNYLTKPVHADDILNALQAPQPIVEKGDVEAMSLSRMEWEYINRVLTECGGNISQAARLLGLHRRSLQRKLAKFPNAR